MKQVLWIGSLENDEEFKNKAQKGCNMASAQVSQKNLILGLEEEMKIAFDSINGSILPPYPLYKDKYIKETIWEEKKGSFNVSVGYKNIKYLNRLTCKKSMLTAAKRWLKERYKGDELIIFAYSMRSPSMATACYIKNKIPNAKIYLIVTDLPQFMDLGENKVKKFLKKIDWIFIKNYKKKIDEFILYAEKMADFLKIKKNKWMLMEGSYNNEEETGREEAPLENKKAIMYSGKLDIQYGIDILLRAFMKIEDVNAELWLTGGGNAEEYIKECCKADKRINFFGFLPERKDVLNLQKKAACLINMRLPSEEASGYCFPSKLFEYMVTGVPVLTYRLEGIPNEYFDYIITIEDESENELIKALNKIINISYEQRKKIGLEARNFILNNKNNRNQARKILNFINNKDKNNES